MARWGAVSRGALAVLAGLVLLTSSARTPAFGATGEVDNVPVLGGLRALAEMASMESSEAYGDFFVEYCRNIAKRSRLGKVPSVLEDLDLYASTISELYRLSGKGSLDLSLRRESRKGLTLRALKLLGWQVRTEKGDMRIEPGDDPADAVRIRILNALGRDALAITRALSKGGTVRLVIPSDSAAVRDGPKWAEMAGGLPEGGYAQLFVRNPRIALAYAGLASMGPGADPLIRSVGLRRLANKHAQALLLYGGRLILAGDRAAVPGGSSAEPAWAHLVGNRPQDAGRFFHAVLDRDDGQLASFYSALAQADTAHQRYFTQNAARLGRFYRWFKSYDEPVRGSWARTPWKVELLHNLPLDESGRVRFPGGRDAWIDSKHQVEDLLRIPHLDALVPVSKLERARRSPLDEASVRLLAAHFSAWRNLLPHLEKLSGLGREEFEALAEFERSLASRPRAELNTVVGQWFSLVKLIELGVHAGSLTPEVAAYSFRQVCQALSSESYSRRAIDVLSDAAGSADQLDEAVPANLLRLRGDRRAAFDRIKHLLGVPPLAFPTGELDHWALMALSGLVYAALLDPDLPLLAYDPLLLTRHQFADAGMSPFIFDATGLQPNGYAQGSYFFGGFMLFEKLASSLPSWQTRGTPAPRRVPLVGGVEGSTAGVLFRTSARLVEVYASVTDERGRFLNRLNRDDFRLLDNGEPVEIQSFDGGTSQGSVALLLDATGSIRRSLSALKISALRLIDELRPADSVAVYTFSDRVREAVGFGADKDAARRAVLGLDAHGGTALHDALAEVAYEIAQRPGKKAIVLFTDGADTASLLTMDHAIRQAKLTGAPVYTVAYGDALALNRLGKQLEEVARSTGGLSFTVRGSRELEMPFRRIAEDLNHGYVLSFAPPASQRHEWHTLDTVLRDPKGRIVRAREGYYPD